MSVWKRILEVGRRWHWIKRESSLFIKEVNGSLPKVFLMQLDQLVCGCYLSGVYARLWGNFIYGGFYFRHYPFRIELRTLREKLIHDHLNFLSHPRLKVIGLFDEFRMESVAESTLGRVLWVPDIVTNSEIDRNSNLVDQIRLKAAGRQIVTSIGLQDRRKGILKLMRLVDYCDLKKYFFVFAGKLVLSSFNDEERSEIEQLLANPSENMFVYPKFINTESEFDAIISESSLVYAVYEEFPFTSNIVGKSCVMKKPILVADGGLMAERVRKYNIGTVVSDSDSDHLREILLTELWKQNYSLIGATTYMAQHSFEKFSRVTEEIIETVIVS